MTDVSTTIALSMPSDTPFTDWLSIGRNLANQKRNIANQKRNIDWLIGDWIAFGLKHFPEQINLALEDLADDPQRLKRIERTAQVFPPHLRQPSLTFDHHAYVADMPVQVPSMAVALEICGPGEGCLPGREVARFRVRVLRYVREHIAEWGESPSQREIAYALGCDRDRVRKAIIRLERAGELVRRPGARGLILPGAGPERPLRPGAVLDYVPPDSSGD